MTLGTAVGVLPGIGPALTVALLLPVTYKLDPAGSLIMFAGIYYGGMYGGSTTSILLNTPGESASIVTALEGNKMARQGRGGPALATAAIGSFVAGLIATLGLAFIAPTVVKFALSFGPAEYFGADAARLHDRLGRLRRFHAARPDVAVHRPGARPHRHRPADRPDAADHGPAESVRRHLGHHAGRRAVRHRRNARGRGRRNSLTEEKVESVKGSVMDDAARTGSAPGSPGCAAPLIGFPIGAMPAGGADVRASCPIPPRRTFPKHPEEFGNGAIEGVAGPEAANNASAAGTLVPLLTLGLPTTATAAIMLAGFQQFGLQPGPLLFVTNAPLVWGLIASLLVANFMLLVLNLPLIGLWVKLLTIPKPWLYAGILVFATLGTIGADASIFSLGGIPVSFGLGLLLLFGLAGLRAAPLPLSDRAGGGRPHSRADGGEEPAPGVADQPGQPGWRCSIPGSRSSCGCWPSRPCFCRSICAGAARTRSCSRSAAIPTDGHCGQLSKTSRPAAIDRRFRFAA